jgi:hypothetical protein
MLDHCVAYKTLREINNPVSVVPGQEETVKTIRTRR